MGDTKPGRKGGLFDWLRGAGNTPAPEAIEEEPAEVSTELPQTDLEERLKDEGEIARGGMGSIRRVFDRNLRRRVAMKVLDPKVAEDPVEVQRFLEEAQVTGQLEHPNIPPVHELTVDGDTHFFTMKLVQGTTLEQIMAATTFTIANEENLVRVLKILVKVCEALSFAHSKGVVHLDLKPANIMVGSHGQVYLMDWGIARLLKQAGEPAPAGSRVEIERTDELDEEGKVLGTLAFMAPEQADGRLADLDERTDIFSLGAILYRALAGKAPITGKTLEDKWEAAKRCEIRPIEEVAKVPVPIRLSQMAMKALTREKEGRHRSIDSFQEELESFLRGPGRFPIMAFAAGQPIIQEGEQGDAAYIVMSGRVQAYKLVSGAKQILRSMGPGSVFGETAILTSQPRTASVEAAEATEVMVVGREHLDQELGQSTWMGPIVKALAGRFREADERASRQAAQLRSTDVERIVLLEATFSAGPRGELKWSELGPSLARKLGRDEGELLKLVRGMSFISIRGDSVVFSKP